MNLPETEQIVLGIPVLVFLGLSVAARQRPDNKWLRPFNLHAGLSDKQRARLRRTQQSVAGAELILLGIIIPLGYFAVKVVFFGAIRPAELVVAGALSVVCLALGLIALARHR